jgi:formylglycine-generating enzyme required for sulfatase activity
MATKLLLSTMLTILSAFMTINSVAQRTITSSSYKPGQTFRDCADCPEMVVLPAGSFTIGSPENEPGRYPEEGPQRKVNIKQIAVGKFTITKQQWALFVKETNRPVTGGCSWAALPGETGKPWDSNPSATWNHIGFMQDSSHPVVCITWYDANDYVSWLKKRTGYSYRMLSEAEWEYATRAGTTTAYYWGDSASHEYANYGLDTTFGMGYAKGRDKWLYGTSPVGSFPPNAFGLHDMCGNVNQFLADCFLESYINLPTDGSAYKANRQLKMTGDLSSMTGTNSCSYRMVRGGNFGDPPSMLRSAFRSWAPGPGSTLKSYSSSALGFRVARTL